MTDFHVEFDPYDSEKPTTLSGRITFDKTPESWIGKSAGWLRSIGAVIEEHVPDCAVLKRDANGGDYFDWVTLEVTINKGKKD